MSNTSTVRPTRIALREDANLEQVPVRIGDIRAAASPSLLFTVGLGSCVAIALYDPRTHVAGLAHPMLPEPPSAKPNTTIGRYVSSAVPELINVMVAAGAARDRLRARLAGGASMFRDVLEGDGLRLGRRNVEAAHRELEQFGIEVAAEDVFGTYGRSVFLRSTDGELLITSVNRPDVFL